MADIEAQQKSDGDPVVVAPEVNTNFLKALFHHLVLVENHPIGEADPEVAEPEEEEVSPYTLVDTAFPQQEKPEEGPNLTGSVNMVHVSHSHPSQEIISVIRYRY